MENLSVSFGDPELVPEKEYRQQAVPTKAKAMKMLKWYPCDFSGPLISILNVNGRIRFVGWFEELETKEVEPSLDLGNQSKVLKFSRINAVNLRRLKVRLTGRFIFLGIKKKE